MVDYYAELSLAKESDIRHIQEELVRLESLWHKREVNSPEKANKMLGLIMDAQKAFASEASRKKYDSDLEVSRRELEDPDVLRSKSLEKWIGQARMFYNDGQYDLAKASIDRALNYINSESDNGDLFRLAANIYLENGDTRLSLECINKAIITSPDWADYYIVKARIYERMFLADQQYDKRQNDISECKNNLMHAVSKAKAGGDATTEGVALGMLAFSLYFHFDPDVVLAEEYARRAEALGEHANSKRVLDDIAEKRNSPIYNEAKKEERCGDLQHLRKALELYESLGDWKDVSERATACRTRIGQLEEKETRRQREEQKRREEQAQKAKAEAEERERRKQAELEAQKKRKERTIKLVKIAAPIAAAIIVVVILVQVIVQVNNTRNSYINHYNTAMSYLDEKRFQEAALEFGKAGNYEDAQERSLVLWRGIVKPSVISIGYDFIVGLKSDGTVIATGRNSDGQCDVSNWENIISVSAGFEHTVGLKSDGTVVAVGSNNWGQCNASKWKNIVQVVAGDECTIGLQSDGRLLFAGIDRNGDINLKDIVEIWMGGNSVIGKSLDGRITRGSYGDDWKDLKKVSFCDDCGFLGLTQDNTVIFDNWGAANIYGVAKVWYWTDIIDIDGGWRNVVGVKRDGTVVFAGANEEGQNDISDWSDIVVIATEDRKTIGVKSDGSVLLVGDIDSCGIDVSGWKDIMLP